MARTLTMRRTTVPARDRPAYIQGLAVREAYYTAARCRFWVFEDVDFRGVFVEFVEADDAPTLMAAQRAAPGDDTRTYQVYQQVEID